MFQKYSGSYSNNIHIGSHFDSHIGFHHDQIRQEAAANGSIRFLDRENLGKDTSFIIVAEVFRQLQWML